MIFLLRWLGRIVLRIFFRRIAIINAERLPATGPVILVANHPNALVDPLFFLALIPRQVSFLAKSTLFPMPILGWIVKASGAIPVYRHQDLGKDTSGNKRMFLAVYQKLHRNGVVALFPEGVSHDDPVQRPFKTGAARLAIGAAATSPTATPVKIIPVGIYYTAKTTFRSSAVLCYGEALTVPPEPLDQNDEPLHESVHALTARIEYAIEAVTLQADQHEALELIGRAERMFSAASGGMRREQELMDQFELRRRLLAGYKFFQSNHPARLAQLVSLIRKYEMELSRQHLAPESLSPSTLNPPQLLSFLLRRMLPLILIFPLAIYGILVHFVAYRITEPLSRSMAKGSLDMIATIKILASAALYPLSWLLVGLIAGTWLGAPWGTVATLVAPIAGWAAMIFMEQSSFAQGEIRAVILMYLRPSTFRHLMAERRQVRQLILALDRELPD